MRYSGQLYSDRILGKCMVYTRVARDHIEKFKLSLKRLHQRYESRNVLEASAVSIGRLVIRSNELKIGFSNAKYDMHRICDEGKFLKGT